MNTWHVRLDSDSELVSWSLHEEEADNETEAMQKANDRGLPPRTKDFVMSVTPCKGQFCTCKQSRDNLPGW